MIFGELDIKIETSDKWPRPWRVLISSQAGLACGLFQTEEERNGFVTGFRMAAEKADAAKAEVEV